MVLAGRVASNIYWTWSKIIKTKQNNYVTDTPTNLHTNTQLSFWYNNGKEVDFLHPFLRREFQYLLYTACFYSMHRTHFLPPNSCLHCVPIFFIEIMPSFRYISFLRKVSFIAVWKTGSKRSEKACLSAGQTSNITPFVCRKPPLRNIISSFNVRLDQVSCC